MGRRKGSRNKPKNRPASTAGNGGDGRHLASDDNRGKSPPSDAMSEENRKVLFASHLDKYKRALETKKAADARFKNTCKIARAECGDDAVARIKTAIDMETPEGEARVKAEIVATLEVARWMGAPIGTQFTLFAAGEDLSPADRAYAEGEVASRQGQPAKPPYAPETPEYRQYMTGFHDQTAKAVSAGIKKLPETSKELEQAFDKGDGL
jgi:hypothetical protein